MQGVKDVKEYPRSKLVLRHANGELREVPVVTALRWANLRLQKPMLVIQWSIAGAYDFDLERGCLVKATLWRAVSLRDAWAIWLQEAQGSLKEKLNVIPKEYWP